jgi:hypothetical protein
LIVPPALPYTPPEGEDKAKMLMALARADLESLLRARQLDRTLTTALPPLDPRDESALAPSGLRP